MEEEIEEEIAIQEETDLVIDLIRDVRLDEASEHIKTNPKLVYAACRRKRGDWEHPSVLHEICKLVRNFLPFEPDDNNSDNEDEAEEENAKENHRKLCELAQLVIDISKQLPGGGKSMLLLAAGFRNTPLHTLCGESQGDPAMMKIILDSASSKANNESSTSQTTLPTAYDLVTAQNCHGCTPLHFVADGSDCSDAACELMLSYCDEDGPDPTLVQDGEGDTCLHWAFSDSTSVSRLRLLLRHSAASLVVQNENSELPLDICLHQCKRVDIPVIEDGEFEQIDIMVRAFYKCLDHEEWWPLHGIIQSPFCPPFVVQQAIAFYNDEIAKRNDEAMLPLHTALVCHRHPDYVVLDPDGNGEGDPNLYLSSSRIPTIIRHLLQAYPDAARMPTGNGRLPLFVAVEHGHDVDTVKMMYALAPHALSCHDIETRLYPFMLAAVKDNNSLDVVYELLHANPELVRMGVPERRD